MQKTIHTIILLAIGIVVFQSCNKLFPFDFAEGNNVESFKVHNFTNGVQLGTPIINPDVQDSLNGNYGSITLVVNKGSNYFPLVFKMEEMKLSDGAVIRNWSDSSLGITFLTPNDKGKDFFVVSAKGNVKKWVINILDRTPPPIDPNTLNTNIISFWFTPTSIPINAKETLESADIAIKNDSILLIYYTDGTAINFPISIKPSLELPKGANLQNPNDTINTMSFASTNEVKTIVVLPAAEGGKPQTWKIRLKPIVLASSGGGTGGPTLSDEAKILTFTIGNYAPFASLSFDKPVIDESTNTVYLTQYNDYSFSKPIVLVVGTLVISPNAKTSVDYIGNFSFNSFNDTKNIVITAENGKQKTWKIKLLYSPQLNNSGFEQWSSKDGYSVVNGGQWVANNFLPNSMVSAVSIVNSVGNPFEGSKCAEITTQYIIRGAAGVNSTTPVSAGMVFLGAFNFSASEAAIKNPLSTYNFGIPFAYSPTYIHVAIKYLPFTPAIQATVNSFSTVFGNAVPSFGIVDTKATDKCGITINIKDIDGNIIGTGNYSTSNKIADWQELYIPITYTGSTAAAKLDIRFASSQGGLSYLGGSGATGGGNNATGSKLYIDDIKLWYTPVATMPK